MQEAPRKRLLAALAHVLAWFGSGLFVILLRRPFALSLVFLVIGWTGSTILGWTTRNQAFVQDHVRQSFGLYIYALLAIPLGVVISVLPFFGLNIPGYDPKLGLFMSGYLEGVSFEVIWKSFVLLWLTLAACWAVARSVRDASIQYPLIGRMLRNTQR